MINMTKLEEFDKYTGIEKMRVMVKAFNNCRESFLDQFDVKQLIKIYRAWLGSAWDFYPDTWEPRQIREALRGRSPWWDKDGKPLYPKYIKLKPNREDMSGFPVLIDNK